MFFTGDPLYVGFDLTIASFDSISEVSMVSSPLQSGVIQQLREPNFILGFDPPTPSSGHFTYYLLIVHVTKSELSTDHLPTFSCPLSY